MILLISFSQVSKEQQLHAINSGQVQLRRERQLQVKYDKYEYIFSNLYYVGWAVTWVRGFVKYFPRGPQLPCYPGKKVELSGNF